MRVAIAAAMPYPSPQGTQVFVAASARALAAVGHDVTLVCYAHGDGPVPPSPVVVRGPRLPGYRRMRSGPDPVKPGLDLALAVRVARTPADVVLAHHVEGLAAAVLARRRTGVPVVWVCHTLLEEELGSYLPWGPPRGLGAAVDRVASAVDRAAARHADVVVTLSPRAAAWFRAFGHPRVYALPPAVDPADFEGVTPVRTARPTLVYAGNPDRYQDLHVIVAAMARLPEVALKWVGHAPGFPAGVGEVVRAGTWDECRNHLAGAAVAAVPRARCAGVPVKLLNALALGVPVVVAAGSARGLPGEVVVPDGDPAAFAAGVRLALRRGHFDPGEMRRVCAWQRVAEVLGHTFREAIVSVSRQVRVY